MASEYRNRVILPAVLPLLVIIGLAVAVAAIALILLFNTRVLALTLAIVMAAGIIGSISLANAVDEQDMTLGRRGVIVLTGVLPMVAAAGVSLWAANGGVPADQLMINRQPVVTAPEGAVVGAQNDQSFCVFEDPEAQEVCTDVDEVTLPAQPDSDVFRFLFVNIQAGIQHNFQIFELAGSVEEPEPGEELFGVDEGSTLITGVEEIIYGVESVELAEGDQYYYNCIVHPVMNGVLTIGPPVGAEGAETAAEG